MRVQLGVLEIREAIEEYIRNRIPQAGEILIDGSSPFAHIANVRITLMEGCEETK